MTWPALPFESWKDTRATLHMWTQVVGKVRLALSPFENHWWHVALYVTARGLTTSPIPVPDSRGRSFEIHFDFLEHRLVILTSDGARRTISLHPRSVADFYRAVTDALRELEIPVVLHTLPSEVPDPIRFEEDEVHASYDPMYAERFWRALAQVDMVLKRHRSRFIGKCSPVNFYWGGFDLALTFFSGRRAPERPEADHMMREAMSHEEISCGFWQGDARFQEPVFYSYVSPAPPGIEAAKVRPAAAYYNAELGEFLLRYDDVRRADAPERLLLDFFESTYEAGATLAGWDRAALESRPD